MIASFLSVQRLPADTEKPERFQIGFMDSEERSWSVWMKADPDEAGLATTLAAISMIALNPEKAAEMGFITEEDVRLANEARNRNRLIRGMTPERKM